MIGSWQQLSNQTNNNNSTGDLQSRQQQWLFDCLKFNSHTEYGKQYRFNELTSVRAYQATTPIVSYPEISNYIDKIKDGSADILFAGHAVAFERTSGSTQAQKMIPYSPRGLNDFRKAILPWLANLVERFQIESGSAYWAISPAIRQPEVTQGGVPVGLSDAAYLGEDLIPFFMSTSAVPHWVGTLSDMRDWQLVTLYHLLCNRELVLISVWSPTFLLSLLNGLVERRAELEKILLNGVSVKEQYLAPDPQTYELLQSYYKSNDISCLWPDLKVISCWADASSQPFYQQLVEQFPAVAIQAKGLLLTEGVVTVPNQNNQTVLTANSGFYEFEASDGTIKLAHELIQGEQYDVIMTTASGLYRYRTADKIVCDGYSSDLPVLRFIGRGNLCSDLVGEKLTEAFVSTCLEGIPGFRMLIPSSDDQPGYQLVLDKQIFNNKVGFELSNLLKEVSVRLFENPQYAYACKIGQLAELKPLMLADPLTKYLNSQEKKGVRIGDVKVPSLYTKSDFFEVQMGTAA